MNPPTPVSAEISEAVDTPVPDLPGLDSPLSATNNGPGLVYARLLALKRHVAPLSKDNPFEVKGTVRYRFRGIDDLYNHLHGLLGEFGLLFVPREVVEVKRAVFEAAPKYEGAPGLRSNHVAVIQRYAWIAEDGSSIPVELPGEGMDAGDKGTGKALSMAQKYGLVQSLNLPTGEPDADDFLTEGTPAAQAAHPRATAGQNPEPFPAPGGPAPSAPLTAPGAELFADAKEASATIRAIKSSGEQPGVRRRIYASVNAQRIRGGEANGLMAELEQHMKGLRN